MVVRGKRGGLEYLLRQDKRQKTRTAEVRLLPNILSLHHRLYFLALTYVSADLSSSSYALVPVLCVQLLALNMSGHLPRFWDISMTDHAQGDRDSECDYTYSRPRTLGTGSALGS